MAADAHNKSNEALLKSSDEFLRPSLDESSEDESAALVGGERQGSVAHAYDRVKPRKPLRWRSRRAFNICLIVLLGVVGFFVGSGYYVYKAVPPDGQSPPCRDHPRRYRHLGLLS